METTYKGILITFDEHNENWCIKFEKGDYSNPSLSKVKTYIDKLLKKDFKPITCLKDEWREGYARVTITSIADDGDIWYKDENGCRGKVGSKSKDTLKADNESNLKIIQQVKELESEINIKRDLVNKLEKSLEPANL